MIRTTTVAARLASIEAQLSEMQMAYPGATVRARLDGMNVAVPIPAWVAAEALASFLGGLANLSHEDLAAALGMVPVYRLSDLPAVLEEGRHRRVRDALSG